ncbi:MAG: hypothetical protein ACJ764_00650 [Solirubrobacteraceae bacterium]
MRRGGLRRWQPIALGAALSMLVLGAGTGAASTGRAHHRHRPAYKSGTYYGKINQTAPKSYTGKIHFVVRHGKITHLTFTAGAKCGRRLWSVVREKPPGLVVKVKPNGSFSYRGTISERHIRFTGQLSGHTAHGRLFESFPTGALICSMGKPAAFTATR